MASPNIPAAQPFETGFEFQVQVGVSVSNIIDHQNNRSGDREVVMLHRTHFDGLDFEPTTFSTNHNGSVSEVAAELDELAASDPTQSVLDALDTDEATPLKDLQEANKRANKRNFDVGMLDGALASTGIIGTTWGIYIESAPLTVGSFIVGAAGLLDAVRRSVSFGSPEEGQEGAIQRLRDAGKASVLASLIKRSVERSKDLEESEVADSAVLEPTSQE